MWSDAGKDEDDDDTFFSRLFIAALPLLVLMIPFETLKCARARERKRKKEGDWREKHYCIPHMEYQKYPKSIWWHSIISWYPQEYATETVTVSSGCTCSSSERTHTRTTTVDKTYKIECASHSRAVKRSSIMPVHGRLVQDSRNLEQRILCSYIWTQKQTAKGKVTRKRWWN